MLRWSRGRLLGRLARRGAHPSGLGSRMAKVARYHPGWYLFGICPWSGTWGHTAVWYKILNRGPGGMGAFICLRDFIYIRLPRTLFLDREEMYILCIQSQTNKPSNTSHLLCKPVAGKSRLACSPRLYASFTVCAIPPSSPVDFQHVYDTQMSR